MVSNSEDKPSRPPAKPRSTGKARPTSSTDDGVRKARSTSSTDGGARKARKPAGSEDGRKVRGEETRAKLVESARAILGENGYAGLTTRAVAQRAGLPLSVLHHHFGGKRGLLLAATEVDLDEVERWKAAVDGADSPVAALRLMVQMFREDLGSGTIRSEWELLILGLEDEEFLERWRQSTNAWLAMYQATIERWASDFDQLPLPPPVLATLITDLFLGAEIEYLAGIPDHDSRHLALFDATLDALAARQASS